MTVGGLDLNPVWHHTGYGRREALRIGDSVADIYHVSEGVNDEDLTMITAFRDTLYYISLIRAEHTAQFSEYKNIKVYPWLL